MNGLKLLRLWIIIILTLLRPLYVIRYACTLLFELVNLCIVVVSSEKISHMTSCPFLEYSRLLNMWCLPGMQSHGNRCLLSVYDQYLLFWWQKYVAVTKNPCVEHIFLTQTHVPDTNSGCTLFAIMKQAFLSDHNVPSTQPADEIKTNVFWEKAKASCTLKIQFVSLVTVIYRE